MDLQINNITKRFGKKVAVNNVSLKLSNGVWGLLGANGAGKTTLMSIIAGILTPTTGNVTLNGEGTLEMKEEYYNIFGYLPQDFGYNQEFTVNEYMRYIAALKGSSKIESEERINELLMTVGLQEVKKKYVRKLSGGMQRRVGIAQALLNDPKILVLDEPTSGLDPAERVHLRNILSGLGQDRIILISTHIVSDVEYIAKKNFIMKEGQIVAFGTTDELLKQVQGQVWECTLPAEEAEIAESKVLIVNRQNKESKNVLIRYISENIYYETSLSVEPKLEDLYLKVFYDDILNERR